MVVLGHLNRNYLVVRLFLPSPEAPVTVAYTLFKEEVGKGNVEAIHSQGESITGRFKAPVTYLPANEKNAAPKGEPQTTSERGAVPRKVPKAMSNFTTTLPTFVDPALETSIGARVPAIGSTIRPRT